MAPPLAATLTLSGIPVVRMRGPTAHLAGADLTQENIITVDGNSVTVYFRQEDFKSAIEFPHLLPFPINKVGNNYKVTQDEKIIHQAFTLLLQDLASITAWLPPGLESVGS